jgi:hypothetical protein
MDLIQIRKGNPVRLGFIAISLSTLAGCWSSTTSYTTSASSPPGADRLNFVETLMVKGAGKTAVFCLNGDDETRHRLEAYITGQMKNQGFDAYAGRLQIPSAERYSAEELATLLLKEGFQSVAQVTYSGDVPREGLPVSLNFSLHAIPSPHAASYSALQTTLGIAMQSFIQALISVAAR